jgi:hypothetical protein
VVTVSDLWRNVVILGPPVVILAVLLIPPVVILATLATMSIRQRRRSKRLRLLP